MALAASIVLGAAGDALFHATPLGLNLPVWTGLLAGATALITRISPLHSGLAIPLLFFSAAVAWRDAGFLRFWNTVAVLALLLLPVLQAKGVILQAATLTEYVRGAVRAGLGAPAGVLRLVRGTGGDQPRGAPAGSAGTAALVGVTLAVPPVVVFGALFASADPAFGRMIEWAAGRNGGHLVEHLVLVVVFAAAGAGYLAQFLFPDRGDVPVPAATGPRLGLIEVGIPMGATVLIFATFVSLQLTYLFGGAPALQAASGLTAAEYARRGFFELVAACTLVVPQLLAARHVVRLSEPSHARVFAGLAYTQLVLVGIVMLSALQRMSLYVRSYGLTDDRLYATAFMVWIGIVLVWFAVTALRGRPRRFALGAIVSGLAVLATLNVVNPDALIARVNTARAAAGQSLDVRYASRLSADARPTLLTALPTLPAAARCALAERMAQPAEAGAGWRGWNLGRWRAAVSTRNAAGELRRIAASPPCRGA